MVDRTRSGKVSVRAETSQCFKSGTLNNNSTTTRDLIPIPGSALTAFLKHYKQDLLVCNFTNEKSRILDNVDQLLILVERGANV